VKTTKQNDGGPAFPKNGGEIGMSLRDWFAGQALAVLADTNVQLQPCDLANYAYDVADSMIAERAKKE